MKNPEFQITKLMILGRALVTHVDSKGRISRLNYHKDDIVEIIQYDATAAFWMGKLGDHTGVIEAKNFEIISEISSHDDSLLAIATFSRKKLPHKPSECSVENGTKFNTVGARDRRSSPIIHRRGSPVFELDSNDIVPLAEKSNESDRRDSGSEGYSSESELVVLEELKFAEKDRISTECIQTEEQEKKNFKLFPTKLFVSEIKTKYKEAKIDEESQEEDSEISSEVISPTLLSPNVESRAFANWRPSLLRKQVQGLQSPMSLEEIGKLSNPAHGRRTKAAEEISPTSPTNPKKSREDFYGERKITAQRSIPLTKSGKVEDTLKFNPESSMGKKQQSALKKLIRKMGDEDM